MPIAEVTQLWKVHPIFSTFCEFYKEDRSVLTQDIKCILAYIE